MYPRATRSIRIGLLLVAAFAFGGASAEVAVRTARAVERVRTEREIGAAGQLVALELTDSGGSLVARPRLIAPRGKTAELVLHDPSRPDVVRLAFRVEAEREPTGEIALDYELWIPERAVSTRGKISLTPGVEQAIPLGDGTLVATWLAMPVPSAQFDAYLEAERALRRSGTKTS
ncbi:MAG TPA: hypothetical protein VML50_06505 [Anaeromyxobacter sp.]|nr:hypothetical protein [Anaeromyxobacter sp.]